MYEPLNPTCHTAQHTDISDAWLVINDGFFLFSTQGSGMEETVWEQYTVNLQRVWNSFTLTNLLNTGLRVTCLEMCCRRAPGLWTRSFMLVAKEATEHTLHRWMSLLTNRLEPPAVPRLNTLPASLTHNNIWNSPSLMCWIDYDYIWILTMTTFTSTFGLGFIPKNVFYVVYSSIHYCSKVYLQKAVFIWPKIQ